MSDLPLDLELVADLVYIHGGDPGHFYLECGVCGRSTDMAEELSLAEVIDWARAHHTHTPPPDAGGSTEHTRGT